jgi:hypothetical protein
MPKVDDMVRAMPEDIGAFAALPPQGYAYMTPLQRFDHKVRCAVLEVLGTKTAGTWNVSEALRQIIVATDRLAGANPPNENIPQGRG